jgi:hypothetical protein
MKQSIRRRGNSVSSKEETGMNCRLLHFILIVFVMTSGMFLSTAKATPWLNLPSVPVTIKLVNGTTSYYVATLSNVPVGYDVANGVYPNWCVDRRYITIRDASIEVLLYSSLGSPANLEPHWDMVNYILNHKQGSMMDIQDAIWYFVKMGSMGWWPGSAPSATSLAIVNDALANGMGYMPSQDELLAVICYPPTTPTQITIIETKRPVSVGGSSYSMEKTNNAGHLMPYLTSITILAVFLVEFRRKTGKKAREGPRYCERSTI